MLDSLGVERRDLRNFSIILIFMFMSLFVFVDGPLLVRFVVATVICLVSGGVFLLVTALLNRYKPEY